MRFDSVSVTRSDLTNFQVVCQVQKKFILCRLRNRLFAVDQHAASERVNVQWLQNNFSAVSGSRVVQFQKKVNGEERCLVDSMRLKLEDHGWRFTISRSTLEIFRAPAIGNIACTGDEFLDFAKNLAAGDYPAPLHRIVATAACHRSVRFGDFLNLEKAGALMRDFCMCDFPFQCAHGRPTIFPLPLLTTEDEYIL